MAIAIVQEVSGSFAASTSGRTFAFPANVTAGNFLAVALTTYNSTSITVAVTDGLGNTYSQAGSYANGSTLWRNSVWYAANISGGACTITITPSASAFVTAYCAEYSGVVTSSPLDNTSTNSASSTTNLTTGTITVSQNGDLLFGALNAQAYANTFLAELPGAVRFFQGEIGSHAGLVAMDGITNASSALKLTAGSSLSSVSGAGASFKAASTSSGGGLLLPRGFNGGFSG